MVKFVPLPDQGHAEPEKWICSQAFNVSFRGISYGHILFGSGTIFAR